MGSYRHLSREDREEIAVLRAAGHSNAGIAAALGPFAFLDSVTTSAKNYIRLSGPAASHSLRSSFPGWKFIRKYPSSFSRE